MITLILCLAFAGALGEQQNVSRKQLDLLDLKSHVQGVMDYARYYLNEGAPSITKSFIVENPEEIIRLESKLKEKILEDLLHQLVTVWAEMNARVLQGYKLLRSLRDKAEILVKNLREHGLESELQSDDIHENVAERVKELLDSAKQLFCTGPGNLTGLVQTEKQLIAVASRLEYINVKNHLLRMVYDYRLSSLLNVSKDMTREEHDALKEIWSMVSSWGKWSVLDLMVFINEPLNDLHAEVEKYVDNMLINMQELIDETMAHVLEIAVITNGNFYDEVLAKLITMMTDVDNPLYVLCGQ